VSFLQRLPKFQALCRRNHFFSESAEVSFASDEEGIGCRGRAAHCHNGTGNAAGKLGGRKVHLHLKG